MNGMNAISVSFLLPDLGGNGSNKHIILFWKDVGKFLSGESMLKSERSAENNQA